MRIRTRLVAAVLAAGTLSAAVTAGTSPALAEPAAPGDAVSAQDKPVRPDEGRRGAPEEAVELLAAKLGISTGRSRQVFHDLEAVEARGEEIVRDPAFVAIADGLGITPEHLLEVLREVKLEIGGGGEPKPAPKPGEPGPGPKPVKPEPGEEEPGAVKPGEPEQGVKPVEQAPSGSPTR